MTTFSELTEPHRGELQLHCYRMLGSVQDAEDMVQETLVAAWRRFSSLEDPAALRAWLYRIATNRCLNLLRARSRRPREVPALVDAPEPTRLIEPVWLEPYPGPDASYEAKETVELAFMVALQTLPPRQRAVLVLRDVLGFRGAEVAEMLDSSDAAVKGALQRARATLREQLPDADRESAPRPDSAAERRLLGRFAEAAERGDVDAMVALLTADARLTMPPLPLQYVGRAAIAGFLGHREQLRGVRLRLVPTRANAQPAFACYLPDPHVGVARAYALFVLTLEGNEISAITWFGDASLLSRFGLPATLGD